MAEAPPLSIRLGAERLERVKQHMARRRLPVRAAVSDLVDLGLEIAESREPGPFAPARKVTHGYTPGAVTAEALRRLKETPDHD